jgi:disulfide bond formation protein DsbB
MNANSIHYLNVTLGFGSILLQIFSVVALFLLFFRPKENRRNFYLDFLDSHFLELAFFISLFSSIFPLVYSEIIHFLPCVLCWWQRVFMFPTFFLFATALWDRDRKVIRYAAPLLSAGFLVSAYQNFFYYFGENSSAPCDATGVSCYQHVVSEFGGYISIPMMALSAFFALLTLLAVAHFYKKELL